MRFSALLVPFAVVVAGAAYFFARPKDSGVPIESRYDAPVDWAAEADAKDGAIIRRGLAANELSEAGRMELIAAAGRRYMRLKAAYATAPAEQKESVARRLDLARRVCDFAE